MDELLIQLAQKQKKHQSLSNFNINNKVMLYIVPRKGIKQLLNHRLMCTIAIYKP